MKFEYRESGDGYLARLEYTEQRTESVPKVGEKLTGNQTSEDSDFNGLNEGEARLNDLNAAHGVAPAVYSIFTGRKPYLDEYLAQKGKLTFVDSIDKVSQIQIAKRERPAQFVPENPELAAQVTDQLISLPGA